MERFYFFAKTRVALAIISLFTLAFSFNSNAQSFAVEVIDEHGIDLESNILGAPDGHGAQVWTNGDYIVVRMSTIVPAGSEYYMTWRRRSGADGAARPFVYESSNGFDFNQNPIENTSSSHTWSTSVYIAQEDFQYLKILKQSPYSTDFDIDAISYVSMEDMPELIETCEITGFNSPDGRVFWLPDFGTDFRPSGEGLFLDRYDNGMAHIRGEVSRIADSHDKFLVSLWFDNESTYSEWISQGLQAHSPNLGDETSWTYYSFSTELPNTLIGLDDLEGELLYLEDNGDGYGLQLGDGANSLNSNADGISTWFDYTGTSYGHGDINGTYTCQPEECHNITHPGEICCDQMGCAPFDPGMISNVTLPSGGSGAIEYVWLKNENGPYIDGNEEVIPGANGHSYDPGILSQTTWFRRCARRAGCEEFTGESNWIEVTIENCPVTDWLYDCEDGIEVEIVGGGIQNAIPTSLVFSNPESIQEVVVEAVYKSCNPGSTLNFLDENNNAYTASREVPQGGSSNVWVYRTTLPATSEVSLEDQNNEWCAQSLTAYVFRQTGAGSQTSGTFTHRSGYNNIETVTIDIPTDVAPRNLTVELPISELTPDGRYIYVSASAGGVTENFSERIFDFDGGNCCYKIYTLELANVPGNANSLTVTVDTRHNVHENANGQSWVLAGAVKTDLECAVTCDVECVADLTLECDANTAPEFTGYPSLVCNEETECAREEGDFELLSEEFNGDLSDWSFGAGWLTGDGCAPGDCGTFPNAFIDYSNFHTPYNTKLTSPLLDACCTDNVELSFCMRQDLYGSSDEPGYLKVQYRLLGGNWQTIATYISEYGQTIDYNENFNLPVTGEQFEIRFKAYGDGASDYTMGGWGIDNVVVSAHSSGCEPLPVDVNIDWSFTDESNGSCPEVITRTFTGVYEGEEYSCTQTLTLIDETAPVFNMVEDDFTVECSDEIPTTYAFAMDNCDGNIMASFEDNVNGSGCEYSIDRVFTAVDGCGNAATYTQVITVIDSEAPVILTELEDLDLLCDDEIPAPIEVEAEDNCDEHLDITFNEEIIGDGPVEECVINDGDRHTLWFANASNTLPNNTDNDFMSVGPGNFKVYPNGTAFFSGLVENEDNPDQRFEYQVWLRNASTFEEWTAIPNASSPTGFRQEKLDAGTTIDINDEYFDWTYYEMDTDRENKLIGQGDYAGFEFDILPNPTDFRWGVQVGDKASLQSEGKGLSSWLFIEGEIDGDHFSVQGDFNFRLDDCIEVTPEPSCTETYSIIRTWTASDDCGNSSEIQQTIQVGGDDEAPVFIDFPEDQTATCDDQIEAIEVSAEDNCDNDVEITVTELQEGDECEYTITFTYVAVDDCENETIASYSVFVSDNEAPVFASLPVDQQANCDDIIEPADLSATDNCDDDVTVIVEQNQEGDECDYTVTFVYTATDDCGNSTTGSYSVHVIDDEAPVVVEGVEAELTIECGDSEPNTSPVFSDNCDEELDITAISTISNQNNCGFDIERSWTATDDCGNTITVNQTIHVIDTEAPVFDQEVEDMDVDCADIPDAMVITASDVCDDDVLVDFHENIIGGTCPYEIVRTWTATDDCGNQAELVQVLTVVDNEAPVLVGVPQDMMVECESIPVAPVVTATDNCDNDLNVHVEEDMVDIDDCVYHLLRTWSVSDDCGNTASQTQVIAVSDNTPPVASDVPTELTIECGEELPETEVTFTDNCDSDLTIVVNTELAPNGCLYDYIKSCTATDDCGNSTTVTQTITVVDTTPPVLSGVPEDETVSCEVEIEDAMVTATDACDDDLTISLTASTEFIDCQMIMTRTWSTVDDCGNSVSATQVLTVIDEIDPFVVEGVEPVLTIECDQAEPTDTPVFDDTCDEDLDLTAISGITNVTDCGYDIEKVWTATDDCGNSISVSQVIHVVDTTAPVITCPADYVVNCDNGSSDPEFAGEATATDACSEVEITFVDGVAGDDCPASFERTWTATDACGNSSSCVQLITINDFAAPVIECPPFVSIECGDEHGPEFMGYPTVEDDCSEPTVTFEDVEVSGGCPNNIIRTWTAVDACGNTSTCEQVIEILDTTPPVISGEDEEMTVDCNVAVDLLEPTVEDICDENVELVFDLEVIEGDCEQERTEIYTWTATDECENTSVRTIVINYVDNDAPVLSGVPQNVTYECDEVIPNAEVSVEDNCDTDIEIIFNELVEAQDCGELITRTWTATDDCGNSVTETQVITVLDTTDPIVIEDVEPELTIECGEPEPTDAPVFADNCDEDLDLTAISGITNVTDCGYDIEKAWTATDDCGNSTTVTQVIHVIDTTAPVIICPADYVVNCDNGSSDPEFAGEATATDACSDVEITYVDGVAGDDCPASFERTWTATDACGNSSSCVQIITVTDFAAPVLDCPADVTVECSESLDPVNTGDASATDDCSEPEISYVDGPNMGDCPYSFERTWTAVDACGNSTSCVQLITVIDILAPVLSGEDSITELECNVQPTVIAPEVSDNCDEDVEVEFSTEIIPGDCPNNYTEIYTWMAIDDCGNQSVRTLTFIFSDTQAPELIGVPEELTVECTDIPAVAEVSAIDNCSDVEPVFLESVEDLDCGETITRTWTATDECGNTSIATQIINVIDETAPELIGAPADETVSCDAIPAAASVSATDNCDDDVLVEFNEVIGDGCPYTINRTWTATDDCGNVSTANQVLTVIDEADPFIVSQPENYTVECDDDIPVVDPVFGDNCDDDLDIVFMESREDYDCGAQVTRTWTATDDCGNQVTAAQVIQVVDTTAPEFEDYEVEIEMPCTDIDMSVLVSATDNCDEEVEITFVDTHVSGGCAGRVIRDYTAVDNCGNTSSAQQIITLVDNFDPEAVFVPADVTVECDQPLPTEAPEWFDNCDEDVTVVLSENYEMVDCVRIITRTWTATDLCQNSTSVSQEITVVDTTDPVLIGVPEDATVECSAIPAVAEVSSTDNCDEELEVIFSEEIMSEGCPYTIERTWTVSDDCGNTTTATQVLTVVDTTDPVLVGVPADATVECDAIPAPATVSYTDNCANDLEVIYSEQIEEFECGSTITRTWSVTDDCGNSTVGVQVLTVVDTTDPVLIGVPADTTVECDAVPAAAIVTATDNCDTELEVDFSEEIETLDCGSIITRTWSVSDDCGNSTAASQVLTVVDTTLPEILEWPADVTVECDAIPEIGSVVATDNCDEELSIESFEEFEAFDCGGLLTRTWVATDDCGNSSAISQVITVVDTNGPTLEGIPADVSVECGEEDSVIIPEVTATDTCDDQVDVMFTEEVNDLDCGFEIIRMWRATDNCGNYDIQSQVITVIDTTAPELSDYPQDEVVSCDDEIIAPILTATDICEGDVDVVFNEEIGEGCPYTIVRTWTAVDVCGNEMSHTQIVTVVDEEAPVIEDAPESIEIPCDEFDAYSLEASDNCDADVEVSFSDEFIGFNDPNADKVCEMLDPIDVDPEWSTALFGMPLGYDYYLTTEAYFLEYPDGTAHLVGHVYSVDNPNGGFEIDVYFENGLGWDDWSNQDFPTDFKDDEGVAGNNYLDWTYYILNGDDATLTGTGDFAGSFLTLTHAPDNFYYGFQVGVAANNRNAQYGMGGWFFYDGIFMDAGSGFDYEVSGAGDFAFDGNCCGNNEIERTWLAVDDCGNESIFVQMITIVDEVAPEVFNVPEDVTIACGDDIPEVPGDIFATDNCDDSVPVVLSEVQSNEFCPYTITRTWTAVDDCGNLTTVTQVITVDFEAPEEVFLFSYPNPFNDQFTVQFTVPTDAYVVAKVFDVTGREVHAIVEGKMDAERLYQYTVQNVDWGAGSYTVMLLVDDEIHHHKMLVIQR